MFSCSFQHPSPHVLCRFPTASLWNARSVSYGLTHRWPLALIFLEFCDSCVPYMLFSDYKSQLLISKILSVTFYNDYSVKLTMYSCCLEFVLTVFFLFMNINGRSCASDVNHCVTSTKATVYIYQISQQFRSVPVKPKPQGTAQAQPECCGKADRLHTCVRPHQF